MQIFKTFPKSATNKRDWNTHLRSRLRALNGVFCYHIRFVQETDKLDIHGSAVEEEKKEKKWYFHILWASDGMHVIFVWNMLCTCVFYLIIFERVQFLLDTSTHSIVWDCVGMNLSVWLSVDRALPTCRSKNRSVYFPVFMSSSYYSQYNQQRL